MAPKPKPGKPKPSPRGERDNVSLDRELAGSITDSFDDVPDRRSKMEKMHAVATPLAALMQAKKEHEDHQSEHRRDDDRHHDDNHEAGEHDQSYDHEVGNSSKTNPTNRVHEVGKYSQTKSNSTNKAYTTDKLHRASSNQYMPINEMGTGGSSKMHENNSTSERYLFSYPASSFESVVSQGDYDTTEGYPSGLSGRVGSVHNIGNVDAHYVQYKPISHCMSAELVYSDTVKNHYDEIGPPLPITEGIYAEIDEVKCQVKKMGEESVAAPDLYSEIPVATKAHDTLPNTNDKNAMKTKIHGRKSRYFQENQHFQTDLADATSTSMSHDRTSPKYQTNSSKESLVVKSKETRCKESRDLHGTKPDMLGAKSKTIAQLPVYAKLNKPKKIINKHDIKNTNADKSNNHFESEENDSTNELTKGTNLREELKMYILTPDKISKHSQISNADSTDSKKCLSNISNEVINEHGIGFYDLPSDLLNDGTDIAVTKSGQSETKHSNMLVKANDTPVTVRQFEIEPFKHSHEHDKLHSQERRQIACLPLENVVKDLSLSSFEDAESVHNISPVISDTEQGIVSELETEENEMGLREHLESSSLSCLYKLTFDGSVSNNDADSLHLDEEELEGFSTLSSLYSNIDTDKPGLEFLDGAYMNGSGYLDIENKECVSDRSQIADDDLERFSTISTDSGDFEAAFKQQTRNYRSYINVQSVNTKSRKNKLEEHESSVRTKQENNMVTDGVHDRDTPRRKDEKRKENVRSSYGSETVEVENSNRQLVKTQKPTVVRKGESLIKSFGRVFTKTSKSSSKDEDKKSFEIDVFDEEPYNRNKVNVKDSKHDVRHSGTKGLGGDTMDFFLKPTLLEESRPIEPVNTSSKQQSTEGGIEKLHHETNSLKAVDSSRESSLKPYNEQPRGTLNLKPQTNSVSHTNHCDALDMNEEVEGNSKVWHLGWDEMTKENKVVSCAAKSPDLVAVESMDDISKGFESYTSEIDNVTTSPREDICITPVSLNGKYDGVKRKLEFSSRVLALNTPGQCVPVIKDSKVYVEEECVYSKNRLEEVDVEKENVTMCSKEERSKQQSSPCLTFSSQTMHCVEEATMVMEEVKPVTPKSKFVGQLPASRTLPMYRQDNLNDKSAQFTCNMPIAGKDVPKMQHHTFKAIPKTHTEKNGKENIPTFIKGSKVYTDDKTLISDENEQDLPNVEKWSRDLVCESAASGREHLQTSGVQSDSNKEHEAKIITGNLRFNCDHRVISGTPSCKSENSMRNPGMSVCSDLKEMSEHRAVLGAKVVDTINTKNKVNDNSSDTAEESLQSNSTMVSHISESLRCKKNKVSPGVVHMINPCPSGWMEGGLKTSPKKRKTTVKKKQGAPKYIVSALDFEPQELPEMQDASMSCLASEPEANITDHDIDVSENGDKAGQISASTMNILEYAQHADLLCQRIWKKCPKSRKTCEVKATERYGKNRDGSKRNEDFKCEEFEAEIEKGPLHNAPKNNDTPTQSQKTLNSSKLSDNECVNRLSKLNHYNRTINVDLNDVEKSRSNDQLNMKNKNASLVDIAKGEEQCLNKEISNIQNGKENMDSANDTPSPPVAEDMVITENLGTFGQENKSCCGEKFNVHPSLHSKLQSLGLGDVNIDEDAVTQQTRELQHIDFNIEDQSESDSEPSETDSESGDEVELACFEMPGLTVDIDPQLSQNNESFLNACSEGDTVDLQQFAIDCSFEDVRSYKMGESMDPDVTPILCECNFQHSENVHGTFCELHQIEKNHRNAGDKMDNEVPDIIDDTPHFPVRSNLRTKAKSDSYLFKRRVRFENNLPVYKSSNNIDTQKDSIANEMAYDNEPKDIKYIEDFITCMFDSEPRKLGLSSKWSENVDSDSDTSLFESENLPLAAEDKLHIEESETRKPPKIVKPVSVRRPKLFNVSSQLRTIDDTIVKQVSAVAVTQSSRGTVRHSSDGRYSSVPTIILISPTGDINTNIGCDSKQLLKHSVYKFSDTNAFDVETDTNAHTKTLSDGIPEFCDDVDDTMEVLDVCYSTSCAAELKTEIEQSVENCAAESNPTLTNDQSLGSNEGIDMHENSQPTQEDGHSIVQLTNHALNKTVNSVDDSQILQQDIPLSRTENLEQDAKFNHNGSDRSAASACKPSDQVIKYTFTVNEDSDSESPKIKSVTYEYVTEYKLNNVKIQYHQNRKTQTESHEMDNGPSKTSEKDGQIKYGRSGGLKYKHNKAEQIEENSSRIDFEEVIEKSICYPLGPIHGHLSNDSHTSYTEEIVDDQIEMSINITKSDILNEKILHQAKKNEDISDPPMRHDLLYDVALGNDTDIDKDQLNDSIGEPVTEEVIHKTVFKELCAEKPIPHAVKQKTRSINRKQIIEHDSKKYVWSSFRANIPFSAAAQNCSADSLDKQAGMKEKWSLCDETNGNLMDATTGEENNGDLTRILNKDNGVITQASIHNGGLTSVKNHNQNTDKDDNAVSKENDIEVKDIDDTKVLNSPNLSRNREKYVSDKPESEVDDIDFKRMSKNNGATISDMKENMEGRYRLKQFCNRNLETFNTSNDENGMNEVLDTVHVLASRLDMNEVVGDSSELSAMETYKSGIGKLPADLVKDRLNEVISSSELRGIGNCKSDTEQSLIDITEEDRENIFAAVMQERLPEINVHEHANEMMFVVQAAAAIALGTVLVFLLPYAG